MVTSSNSRNNEEDGDIQGETCLWAINKLLFRLVEGQWIFVPKNEQEATALNSLCVAVDIAFNDLSTICLYLKLMHERSRKGKQQIQVLVEKWDQLQCQLFGM